MLDLTWVYVPGGVCAYGDRDRPVPVPSLWWTLTPLTRGQLGTDDIDADLPAVGVTHGEAAATASCLGGRLPRSAEWEWMASGPSRRIYPWGDGPWRPDLANLRGSGHGVPTRVGSHPAGQTPHGLLDVAGNVWEWTGTLLLGGGAVVRGGSYNSPPLYATCRFLNAAPRELSSPGIGLRVVREA